MIFNHLPPIHQGIRLQHFKQPGREMGVVFYRYLTPPGWLYTLSCSFERTKCLEPQNPCTLSPVPRALRSEP